MTVPKQVEAASSARPSVIPLGYGISIASLQAWHQGQSDEAGNHWPREDSGPRVSQALLKSAQPPCSSEGSHGHWGPRASTSPACPMPSLPS